MDHQAGQNDGFSAASQVGSANSEALHIWRPRPLVRAIEWSATDAVATTDKKAYEVFVMQDTLVELLNRVYSSTGGSEFGFLVGDLCECPETGSRFVLMTSTIEARNRFDENGTPQIPAEAYVAMQLKLDRRVGVLVGWYHVHHDADEVSMSENDIATHEKYFADPWHSALVVAPTPDGPLAGFFRRADGSLSGEIRRPFFEVLSARSFVGRGARHSCVNWTNYEAESDTILIPYEGGDGTTEAPVEIAPPVEPIAPPVEPIADTVEAIADAVEHVFEEAEPAVEMTEPALETDPLASSLSEPAFPMSEELSVELPAIEESAEVEEPAVEESAEIDEPVAPEAPSIGGIAADFADLKEAAPDADDWTPGNKASGSTPDEGPMYSAEPGQSIDRLADRQGELPDQRFAQMRAPYPAPERASSPEPPAPPETVVGGPLAAALGLTVPAPASAPAPSEVDAELVEAQPEVVSEPTPARRKRRRRTRSSRKSGLSGKQLAMAGVALLVIAGGGFAALKLPALLNGDKSAATVRSPLDATDSPAMAAVGGLETDGQGVDAAALGAAGAVTELAPDGQGPDRPVETLAAADSAATDNALLVDAEVVGDTPSIPPAGEEDDPSSVADEVARLAKPLPDRAYAAPVLAIDGNVIELNDERARRAASRRRAAEQAAADSSAQARLQGIRRPVLTAPAPLTGDAGLSDVTIDRPELLQKLDQLSDDLSSALNTYFVETLALQSDEGSCDDVTQALERVDDTWKAYNGALGSPRVVTFEGARAARDVQLSDRVEEVQDSYSGLDCDR